MSSNHHYITFLKNLSPILIEQHKTTPGISRKRKYSVKNKEITHLFLNAKLDIIEVIEINGN